MNALLMLIPIALFLGLLGLAGFLWALKSGQFDDLDGAANRILFDDEEDDGVDTPPASPSSADQADGEPGARMRTHG